MRYITYYPGFHLSDARSPYIISSNRTKGESRMKTSSCIAFILLIAQCNFLLQKMVCHGQHTYVYSQVLLQILAQEPRGGFMMKRLSQEITKCAQQK